MAKRYDGDDPRLNALLAGGDGLVIIAPEPGPGVFIVQTAHNIAAQVFIPWSALEEVVVQLFDINGMYKASRGE